jgi:hypothetical protein
MGKLVKRSRPKRPLDDKTKDRLVRFYRIWRERETAWERDIARAEMERIAEEHGYTIDEIDRITEEHGQATGQLDQPTPPSLAETINALRGIVLQYLVLPANGDLLISLWIAFTFVFKRFMHAPRLVADSVDPGFGKSLLLGVVSQVSNNADLNGDLSAASMYEHHAAMGGDATHCWDEADGYDFRGGDRKLTKIFNDGFNRNGAVRRMRKGRSEKFPVFAPLAVAAIDARATFTRQMVERSIIISMPLAHERKLLNGVRVLEVKAAQAVSLRACRHGRCRGGRLTR